MEKVVTEAVTEEDAEMAEAQRPPQQKIILRNFLSPGDVLVMEAAIASLHSIRPGVYQTDIRTSCDSIYNNHPHITNIEEAEAKVIDMNYTVSINRCDKRPLHFMEGYCHMLGDQLGIHLPCAVKAPKVYISDIEAGWINQVHEETGYEGKFWLLGADIKDDYTIKMWHGWQEVVDYFHGKIQFVQYGNSNGKDLKNVISLRNKTDTRQLIRLAYHAEGILCLESFGNHLAASLNKACVSICSGFLPPYWVSYPRTSILTSFGKLPCCYDKPCWRSRASPLDDGSDKDKSLCKLPIAHNDVKIPKCQLMITPEKVIQEIESFYYGGTCHY